MRHTTIQLILHGAAFMIPDIDPKIAEGYLAKSTEDCIVYINESDEKEYMVFTEKHPMFNVLTLLEGNRQIHNSGVNRSNNDYYHICDIIEILYEKAPKL